MSLEKGGRVKPNVDKSLFIAAVSFLG